MTRLDKKATLVVSALRARATFGKLLKRVEEERGSLIIEKRGRPRAVLMSLQEYVRLAAPEPEILRILGEESEARGTSRMSAREIDGIIGAARKVRSARGSKTRRA